VRVIEVAWTRATMIFIVSGKRVLWGQSSACASDACSIHQPSLDRA
jgi:hypothetical protein